MKKATTEKTAPSGRGPRRKIYLLLLLLAAAALAFSGWQFAKAAREQEQSDAQSRMKPGDSPEQPPDFGALQAENPDIIGWITIAALGVDYPITQTTDNSYYLTHTAQRIENRLGSLFLDFRNSSDFSDFNSVVFGHYISRGGKMFGQLHRMREQATFDQITEGTLHTPGGTYRLEIFASVLASSTSEFYQYIFPSPESRRVHLERIREKAVCWRDIGLTPEDRVVTLSTCSYEYDGARTLVIARIV
ncbi:MAG: class B sortase [Firmicutes bacterium]|nr:class B sortase [Bacillota bacterium]